MTSYDLPILSPLSLDFSDGEYKTEVYLQTDTERAVHVVDAFHEVQGDNLVSQLLKRSGAQFVTEVSSPATAFRESFLASDVGVTSQKQSIEICSSLLAPPMWSRLLVVATPKTAEKIRLDGSSGTHELWHDTEVEIRPGSVLASSNYYRRSGMTSFVRLCENKFLKSGSFKVAVSRTDGFYIQVDAHPDLYKWLINPGEHVNHRQSILTCALARGLEIVRKEHVEDETDSWTTYPTLKELNSYLEKNELPVLDAEHFDPFEVATRIKPIQFEHQLN